MILFITATEYYYYWKAVYSVQVLRENLKVHLKTHTKKKSDILRESVSSHAMKDVTMQVLKFVFVN